MHTKKIHVHMLCKSIKHAQPRLRVSAVVACEKGVHDIITDSKYKLVQSHYKFGETYLIDVSLRKSSFEKLICKKHDVPGLE